MDVQINRPSLINIEYLIKTGCCYRKKLDNYFKGKLSLDYNIKKWI